MEKTCINCGTKIISNDDKFCLNCGTPLNNDCSVNNKSKDFINQPETKRSSGKKIQKKITNSIIIARKATIFTIIETIGVSLFQQSYFFTMTAILIGLIFFILFQLFGMKQEHSVVKETSIKKEKFGKIFMSQNEEYISSLGNGYIANYLAGKAIKKGFAVISDKRVYFKGSVLNKIGKVYVKNNEERIVDIKDITGTGFIYRKVYGQLAKIIISLILMVFIFGYFFLGFKDHNFITTEEACASGVLMGTLLSGIASLVLLMFNYLKKRKGYFEIQYAGGQIAFDTSFYAQVELEDFQKQLRRVKDLYEESLTKTIVNQVTQIPVSEPVTPVTDKADELRKYAKLLEDGLISQDDYDVMKKKVLGL